MNKKLKLVKKKYENGKPLYEYHKLPNGFIHGTLKEWSNSGFVVTIEHYNNGIQEGLSEHFFSDGERMFLRQYKRDFLHGVNIRLSPEGFSWSGSTF